MRAIYAVSADGFVATGQNDKMDWTGHLDKSLFRVLTGVGGVVGVGSTTYDLMTNGGRRKQPLAGRVLMRLSTVEGEGMRLEKFNRDYNGNRWLAGGPTILKLAMDFGMLTEAHICHVPSELGSGIPAMELPNYLELYQTVQFHDRDNLSVFVHQYRRAY